MGKTYRADLKASRPFKQFDSNVVKDFYLQFFKKLTGKENGSSACAYPANFGCPPEG